MSELGSPHALDSRTLRHRRIFLLSLCASLCIVALGALAGRASAFTGPPIIEAQPAVAVAGGFEMKGTVNPYGLDTTYNFEYGTTTAYGTSLPVPSADVGAGQAAVPVSQTVTGVPPNTTYHYRLVATNSAGSEMSGDVSFTTPPDVSNPPPPTPEPTPTTPSPSKKSRRVKVKTRRVGGKTVLTTASGRTLYSLSTEKRGKFVCTKSAGCLGVWHPLLVPKGAKLVGPVKLGTITRPEGGRQATYHGLPLYTFAQDTKPGEANGQGLKDVGTWHAVRLPRKHGRRG